MNFKVNSNSSLTIEDFLPLDLSVESKIIELEVYWMNVLHVTVIYRSKCKLL